MGWDAVPVYMYPLPERPAFPVYGLDDHFDGFRWLIIWNDRRRLYTVTLGHGRPEQGPWVAVETVKKTPYVQRDATTGSGPTGFHDAVSGAVVQLVEMTAHNRTERTRMMNAEFAAIEFDPDDDFGRVRLNSGWIDDELHIDGALNPAFSRRLPEAWATVADLGSVAVAVTGPTSMASLDIRLVDVSATVTEQYV